MEYKPGRRVDRDGQYVKGREVMKTHWIVGNGNARTEDEGRCVPLNKALYLAIMWNTQGIDEFCNRHFSTQGDIDFALRVFGGCPGSELSGLNSPTGQEVGK